MDTLRTQRARKLAELFKLLRQPSENIEDRLKLLNDVSEALRDENSSRIIELENLFQRERDLLLCNLTDESLEILRERQLVVFMDVIKDEENNKPGSKNQERRRFRAEKPLLLDSRVLIPPRRNFESLVSQHKNRLLSRPQSRLVGCARSANRRCLWQTLSCTRARRITICVGSVRASKRRRPI
jgi:hypothetical protein